MYKPFTLNPMKKFYAGFRFGCGCGKKKLARSSATKRTTIATPTASSGVAAAKVYQSANTQTASTTTKATTVRRTV